MPKEYVFSVATFGKWKQQARALKRSGHMPHHQALDHIAKSKGFDNWHHLITEAKLNSVSETAYSFGPRRRMRHQGRYGQLEPGRVIR
jgi:hypothetical protein